MVDLLQENLSMHCTGRIPRTDAPAPTSDGSTVRTAAKL
jgi:hypothetical protein